jgi:hypothetical protein
MIKLKKLLNEGGDKIFIQQNTLWVGWNPNSGTTTQIKGDPTKFRGYWTDRRTDSHYDFNVSRILDAVKHQTPDVSKNGVRIYKIPAWWGYSDANDYTIWGGDKKPEYYIWLYIGKIGNDESVVHLFKTKSEAVAFIK